VARRVRADAELVKRKLARSREHAAELIAAGRVKSAGGVVAKPATAIDPGAALHVTEVVGEENWASRGAHKLLGALAAFAPGGLTVGGKRCLDAGASTGGFTDVLLQEGARQVVAVDVGYGQLVWRLQSDERVVVRDRTNIRNTSADDIGGPVELIVADLSFISLKLVLPAFVACAHGGADVLPMVKPQFEVGKDRLGAGGVVRDPQQRVDAVLDVAVAARGMGFAVRGVVASPLPGPSGNVEYFLWMTTPNSGVAEATAVAADEVDELRAMVASAVEEGPQ
jgi:23S rRNA (cytidine1920-2'-O)/16S rRNA (cytidine1409-2'-O)-methyltransferase